MIEIKRKLYGNRIDPACEVCSLGRLASDKKVILCPRKGIVPLYHSCRKFDYDPIRRIPKRAPTLPTFQQKDFEI